MTTALYIVASVKFITFIFDAFVQYYLKIRTKQKKNSNKPPQNVKDF